MMLLFKQIVRYLFMIIYGKYLYFKYRIRVSPKAYISRKTILSEYNSIHSKVNIINSSIGYATYIGDKTQLPDAEIGSYCSISKNVELLKYTHPTSKFVSTHPAFFSLLEQSGFTFTSEQLFQEELFYDDKKKVRISIGNDVWIGTNVLLMGGIRISDGAIIAAGAVVTRDVLPYEIVGGIPAKTIRFRFNEDEICFLNKIKWWNKSTSWLKLNIGLFSDIKDFRKNFKE